MMISILFSFYRFTLFHCDVMKWLLKNMSMYFSFFLHYLPALHLFYSFPSLFHNFLLSPVWEMWLFNSRTSRLFWNGLAAQLVIADVWSCTVREKSCVVDSEEGGGRRGGSLSKDSTWEVNLLWKCGADKQLILAVGWYWWCWFWLSWPALFLPCQGGGKKRTCEQRLADDTRSRLLTNRVQVDRYRAHFALPWERCQARRIRRCPLSRLWSHAFSVVIFFIVNL